MAVTRKNLAQNITELQNIQNIKDKAFKAALDNFLENLRNTKESMPENLYTLFLESIEKCLEEFADYEDFKNEIYNGSDSDEEPEQSDDEGNDSEKDDLHEDELENSKPSDRRLLGHKLLEKAFTVFKKDVEPVLVFLQFELKAFRQKHYTEQDIAQLIQRFEQVKKQVNDKDNDVYVFTEISKVFADLTFDGAREELKMSSENNKLKLNLQESSSEARFMCEMATQLKNMAAQGISFRESVEKAYEMNTTKEINIVDCMALDESFMTAVKNQALRHKNKGNLQEVKIFSETVFLAQIQIERNKKYFRILNQIQIKVNEAYKYLLGKFPLSTLKEIEPDFFIFWLEEYTSDLAQTENGKELMKMVIERTTSSSLIWSNIIKQKEKQKTILPIDDVEKARLEYTKMYESYQNKSRSEKTAEELLRLTDELIKLQQTIHTLKNQIFKP